MQGPWSAPLIPNPEFKDDPKLYVVPEIGYVGFELWQVKSGSIFDNIMLTHDLEEALQFAKDTWGKSIEGEKAMKEKQDVRAPLYFSLCGTTRALGFAVQAFLACCWSLCIRYLWFHGNWCDAGRGGGSF